MNTVRVTFLFLLLWCLHVAGQSPGQPVKVHVSDEAGQPLAGITVQIKGTPRKYVTGTDGNLTINNVPAGAVLVFSGVSVEDIELAVDGRSEMTARLKRKVAALEDVVVTGFQRIDRKKFTGSAVTVKADSIKLDGVTDISRMLEGRAAGVSIQNVSGTFGTAPKVRIRGATSINGENKPLWVVDGVVLEDIVNVSNEQLTSGDAAGCAILTILGPHGGPCLRHLVLRPAAGGLQRASVQSSICAVIHPIATRGLVPRMSQRAACSPV